MLSHELSPPLPLQQPDTDPKYIYSINLFCCSANSKNKKINLHFFSRCCRWLQRKKEEWRNEPNVFNYNPNLIERVPLIFLEFQKWILELVPKVQSCDVLPLDCGHSAPWPCCNVAIHPTQVMMARASASRNSPQNPLFLFESMHSESGRSSQNVSAN